jgi:hypothetical protein
VATHRFGSKLLARSCQLEFLKTQGVARWTVPGRRAFVSWGEQAQTFLPGWRFDPAMCPLRLVADDTAGPTAVGILVPPSRRTFLIVRPRSLPFDLVVLAEARGTAFREFEFERAGRAAEALFDALAELSGVSTAQADCTRVAGDVLAGFFVRIGVGPFHLLACDRQPGKPYAPSRFADAVSARAAAGRLTALLCPPAGSEQEFYLNTRHFQR